MAVGSQLIGAFTATYWTGVWKLSSKKVGVCLACSLCPSPFPTHTRDSRVLSHPHPASNWLWPRWQRVLANQRQSRAISVSGELHVSLSTASAVNSVPSLLVSNICFLSFPLAPTCVFPHCIVFSPLSGRPLPVLGVPAAVCCLLPHPHLCVHSLLFSLPYSRPLCRLIGWRPSDVDSS